MKLTHSIWTRTTFTVYFQLPKIALVVTDSSKPISTTNNFQFGMRKYWLLLMTFLPNFYLHFISLSSSTDDDILWWWWRSWWCFASSTSLECLHTTRSWLKHSAWRKRQYKTHKTIFSKKSGNREGKKKMLENQRP